MSVPVLQLRNIQKRFLGVHALKGVSLEVHGGEVVALLGENGAGKSTLMKIAGGIEQPDSGDVLIGGARVVVRDVHTATSHGIAFIHQELNLLDNLDVAGNVLLGREFNLDAQMRVGGVTETVQVTGEATPPLQAHRVAPRFADLRGERAADDVLFIADWVADSRDAADQPFVIIDKKGAHVYVFDSGARLLGVAPVLLGAAPGDDTVPGIGDRPLSQVLPHERTTPAGRFVGERGHNARGRERSSPSTRP